MYPPTGRPLSEGADRHRSDQAVTTVRVQYGSGDERIVHEGEYSGRDIVRTSDPADR